MKKILLSITSIIFAGSIFALGTSATFNNVNTSSGNTFATGVIDLKIDNESYVTNDDGVLVYSPTTSWALSSLQGKLFFNFLDLKPGDIGEDTISLHVSSNKAWACMKIKVTSTPENGRNEPELLADSTGNTNDGELQKYLYFIFWADDGDNVYEKGERIFKKGYAKDIFDGKNWTLADSSGNIWSSYKNDPVLPATVKYIGKAWCFGNLNLAPVNQDGKGKIGNNGPLQRGSGITCTGKYISNIAQSDGIKADVSFYVEQSRSNSDFLCKDSDRSDDHYKDWNKDKNYGQCSNNNDDHKEYEDKKDR